MSSPLLRKTWRESRWLLLGCCATVYAFCWLRVWMVSRLETDRFRAILEMLPGDWRRFLSVDIDWLITYQGRISLAYQELIVILAMVIWTVARGSDTVSGELNRGTMEMLLAQPISRLRILWTQAAIAFFGVFLIAASAFGGTCTGVYATRVKEEVRPQLSLPIYIPGVGTEVPLPFGKAKTVQTRMSEKVDVRLFLPATVNLASLGVMVLGFTLLMSAWDRFRWRTIGIVSGTLIAQIMLKIAGMASEGTRWLKSFSLLSAYDPEVFVRMADVRPTAAWSFLLYDSQGRWEGFGPLASHGLLLFVGFACLAGASVVFCRRELYIFNKKV